MMNYTRLIVPLTILALAAILLLAPTNARAALEHNLWALSAAQAAFGNSQAPTLQHNPHPHAYQWMARLELLDDEPIAAIEWLYRLGATRDPFALNTLAQAYYLSGNPEKAIDLWRESNFIEPLVRTARSARNDGNLEVSAMAFGAAYDIAPERFTSDYAIALRRAEKFQQAEAILSQSLETYPNSERSQNWWLILGDIYRDEKYWRAAENAYRNALNNDQSDRESWIRLGWLAFNETGEVEAAIIFFQAAISADPENGAGYFAVGEVLFEKEFYTEAAVWFKDAININPEEAEYHLNYARSLREANQINLAITAYQTLLSQFPEYSRGYYEISHLHYQIGQFADAESAIDNFLKLSSSPTTWHFYRAGLIYEAVGRNDDAITAFQNSLDRNPANSSAQRGLDRLIDGE